MARKPNDRSPQHDVKMIKANTYRPENHVSRKSQPFQLNWTGRIDAGELE